jgi:hypothetical protein
MYACVEDKVEFGQVFLGKQTNDRIISWYICCGSTLKVQMSG